MPELEVSSQIDESVLPSEVVTRLERCWQQVLAELVTIGVGELPQLDVLEITVVDDPTITEVHAQFLEDPTPTDVITFPHGEILVSYDTAVRQSQDYQTDSLSELALYGIHGMLHLAGYDDKTAPEAQEMATRQEQLLTRAWSEGL